MTTIDRLSDFVFYVLNKLNNTIVYYLNEELTQRIRQEVNVDIPDDSIEERLDRLREEINRSSDELIEVIRASEANQPLVNNRTPKQVKDIHEKLKEINDHYKPRCGSMEEFLENEIAKEHTYASFFQDKYIEYQNRKETIEELLMLWNHNNIDVVTIREELNKM